MASTPSPSARAIDRLRGWTGGPLLPIAAILLLVLGTKLWLIGLAANPAPFWDQWDGEGVELFAPYIEGHLTLAQLIAPHNEHRIFFSRLVALAVLELSGNWNVVAEMIANALIHTGFLAMLAWLLRDVVVRAPWLIALFLALMFAVPFGIENTLWGFQSQFYFVLLFSVPALILVTGAEAFAPRWIAGLALAMLAYLAMASGALTPIAAAAVPIVQMLAGSRRRSPREIAGVALLVAGTVFAIAVTQLPPDTGHSRAQGAIQLLSALSRAAGWPLRGPVVAPLLLNAPILLLLWRLVRERTDLRDPAWRLVAIVAWLALQSASLAYGRAAAAVMSRYLDLLALGVVANLGAIVLLLAAAPGRRSLALGWTALVAASLALTATVTLPRFYLLDQRAAASRVEALTRFVATNDAAAFARPQFWAPYPSADPLAAIVRRPAIMGLLPDQFGAPTAVRDSIRGRLALHGGLSLTPAAAQRLAFLAGAAVLALAAALLALAATRRSVR
jgi:hypothetical protein